MSGPPGVHAQFPAGRAGRAGPASVPPPPSPPSVPDPCGRTENATTPLSALVSPWLLSAEALTENGKKTETHNGGKKLLFPNDDDTKPAFKKKK